jgi:hypothetical protein
MVEGYAPDLLNIENSVGGQTKAGRGNTEHLLTRDQSWTSLENKK